MDSDVRGTQIRLLTLQFAPALGGFDTRPLDAFVADKDLLDVREHFFVVRELPYLACLITFRAAAARPAATSADARGTEHQPRRDGRDRIELGPDERALFDTLRTWRRERAHGDGVPPYVIFTDRELAALVRARPTTRASLGAVRGVGERKVERYGEDLLRFLAPGHASQPAGDVAP